MVKLLLLSIVTPLFPIVFVPVNLGNVFLVPSPVILLAIKGVTVTVCAIPPDGVTVKPLVPLSKV